MTGKMLVGFDASEESYEAFDLALKMATSYKLPVPPEINVLSVVQRPQGLNLVDTSSLIDEATRDFKKQLKALEERANAFNLRINTEVAVGCPSRTIAKAAKEKGCPFILVGRKRRSMLSRLISGSVSRAVASRAECTVITVNKNLESASRVFSPAEAV
ncbi:MAG: universal stress protein [Candidatus Sulfobium sp.]